MIRLDGRKLTAPLLAQAVAFVAVLVIGGLTGHGHGHGKPVITSSPSPTRPATSRTSSAPHPSSSAPHPSVTSQVSTSTGDVTELTVQAVGGVPTLTVVVNVFMDDRALSPAPVQSTTLNQTVPEMIWSVPADHTYQVCAKPPQGWTFTDHNTRVLPGWYCTKVGAGTRAQTVRFQLIHHPSPSIGGSP